MKWLLVLALAGCAAATKNTSDGTVVEEGLCPAPPPYEAFIGGVNALMKDEYEKSGLPITDGRVIYPKDRYARYEAAVKGGRCKRVRYLSDGLRVVAYLMRPAVSGTKLPIMYWLRGGNGTFGAVGPGALIQMLLAAEHGYLVVAPQYREGEPGSDGHDEFGGADLHDVLNLAAVVKAQPDADLSHVFLLGGSRGGTQALMAARAGLEVRAIALRGPASDQFAGLLDRPGMEKVCEERIPGFAQHREEELTRRSPVRWAAEIRQPVLIVHAREDWRVKLAQSQALDAALKSEHKLVVYERDDHTLSNHHEQFADDVDAWFRAHWN
jgi:dipeptidyl aminopeptidase/acylaminoacyl peptidase